MNNGLLYFGGLLVVVLAALFAVPNVIDWNGYRGVFEEEASKVLGREVRVGGEVNLKFLPAPYVRFEKVRIANVSGQTGEPFIRADSFKMWLSGSALLRGVLEASKIELEKPALALVVDPQGGGNWANIELKPGDLPFVPRDVALRSVRLSDGSVSIYNAATERVAQVENINGELSADSLRGPFRFKGDAAWSDTVHDIKFATDPAASDGSIGIKLAARAEGTSNSYLLEGRASDIGTNPVFKGSWTGTVAVPGGEGLAGAENGEAPLIDLKADVTADVAGAKLEDLSLSLANAAEPQTITGSAVATWATPAKLDLALNSQWLDIDWLSGSAKGGASFAKLKQLVLGLVETVAGESKASAKINLDRVKLGGENAGGLQIDAERDGAVTRITRFNAGLPGGARLDLSGDMKDNKGKRSFSGNLFIGGSSLARLRDWAAKGGIDIGVTADGAYSLTSKLDIDPARFTLSDAFGTIAGRAMSGDLTVANKDSGRIDLVLQAADLDAGEIFPTMLAGLKTELRKTLGLPDNAEKASEKDLPGDMRLRVITGSLTDGSDRYRDVDVTFELEGSDIRVPSAKVTTASGLTVGLEGKIKKGEGAAIGRLAYDVSATSPDAMRELAQKTGLVELTGPEGLRGLKTGKLAGLIEFGRRTPGAVDLSVDGVLNGSLFRGSGEFDGGFAEWRTRPSRLDVTFDAPTLRELLPAIGREPRSVRDAARAPEGSTPGRATASVVAAGTVANGVATRIEISAPGFAATANGTTVWPEGARYAFTGSGDVKSNDVADVVAFAGLSLPAGVAPAEMHGRFDINRENGAWSLATHDLHLGTSAVSGDVQVSVDDKGQRRISGKIGADRVRIATLFTAVTGAPSAGAESDGDTSAPQGADVWPAGLFDFSALDNTEADLLVSFASLNLSGNLATHEGEMRVKLTPGKISISNLSADAAGGEFTGSADLEKVSNGVTLASKFKLDGAKLSSLSSAAKGTANVSLDGTARAQSPAGLMAVLTGSGHVTLKDATLRGPSIEALSRVVDDVVQGTAQNDTRTISAGLLTALNTSELHVGDREFALQMADGTIKFEPLKIDAEGGKVDATVSADLTSFNLSAACQVTAPAKPLPKPPIPLPDWNPTAQTAPLPPAIVLYDGSLDDLSVIKTSVDVNDLQRELAVRQGERNAKLLEQHRRVDEERARLERERRKTVEAQRAAAIAAERAKKEAEQLPPVIPESAGTDGGSISQQSPAGEGTTSAGASASSNGNTVSSPTITVEPIPSASGDATAPSIDPTTGIPVVAKDQAVVRPRPRPQPPAQRRTSSDEVMKSLRNF